MNKRRIVLAAILLAILSFPAAVAADRWSADELRAILADRIDQDRQGVGIVVGLVDEQGSLVVGHGRRGPDDSRAPDGQTVFEIGSVTKVFTAILLAEMVERDKLGLNDPVEKFLPEAVRVPARDGAEITLYGLATHTSGLPRMPGNFAPADPANPYADYGVQQMYDFISGHELTRKPGERAEYSNLGTALLGHALSRAAGVDYEGLVLSRIAEPLGMQDTAITLSDKLRARLATGHDRDLHPTSNWDVPTFAGAGALRSTVDDMLRFVAANLRAADSPISAALRETHRPREDLTAGKMKIGLGWIVAEKDDRTIHWHNGGTGGYHSFVGFDAEHGAGVVVLSNCTNSIDDIGLHLLDREVELADFEPPSVSSEIPDSPAGAALAAWVEMTRSGKAAAAREHFDAGFTEEKNVNRTASSPLHKLSDGLHRRVLNDNVVFDHSAMHLLMDRLEEAVRVSSISAIVCVANRCIRSLGV